MEWKSFVLFAEVETSNESKTDNTNIGFRLWEQLLHAPRCPDTCC